jgi:tetratricopeptide (TPR) repeat protein
MKVSNITPEFAQNPDYVEYERLLIDLCDSMAEGDEEKADSLREEMDRPAKRLSAAEVMRLNGLSSDLYMITNEEVYESSPYTQPQLASLLAAAWQQTDWNRILELLRKNPQFLSHDKVAYLRARAYEGLGHTIPSLRFMRHAMKLKPDGEYQLFVLQKLVSLGRFEEARTEAEKNMQQVGMSRESLMQLAAILFLSTQDMSKGAAGPIIDRAIQVLEQVLQGDTSALHPSIIVQGYITLGSCYEEIGRKNRALEAYNSALLIQPNNEDALLLRAQLREDTDPGIIQDFRDAVASNASHLSIPALVK